MAKNLKIFEVPGCSTDFEDLLDAPSFKPPPRHLGIHSLHKAFRAVCFCCFATDVPLINVKKCSHNELVKVYLSMIPSLMLLICNNCHHMLKKIEDFKLQIQNNFRNLASKIKPDERCMYVNNISRKATISIVSIKPVNITSKDPLSVSTVHLEIDDDDNLGGTGLCGEESIVKTEPNEDTNPVPQNTEDTNIPKGTQGRKTQYYIELTPTYIKQEKLHPMQPSTNKNPLIPNKNILKNYDDEILPMTSKRPLLGPNPMKQIIEKRTNNHLVNLLNSVNKPLNIPEKYKTEQNVEKNASKTVKDEPSTVKMPDVYLDECYEGKIGTVILTEVELFKEREKEKLDESFMKNRYKCDSCIESFQYEVQLNKHNKRYHTKEDYPMECIFCKKRYLAHGTLDRHLEKHLVRYFCLVCNKQSDNLHAVTEHYNETHKDKEPIQMKFECNKCTYVTYYKARFNNHKHRMHKIYSCKICNKKLNGYGSHKYHMKFVHDHDDDKDVKEKGFYKCDECPASYTHFGSLKAHKKSRHVVDGQPTPVYCQPCNKFLGNKFTYNEHLKHSAAHKHENNYLKFECDHCHEKFPVKRSLKLHIERQHLNIFNHKCNICNKLCVHDQALAKHISTVHEKKRPPKTDVCHICGKVYCSKEVLKKHMRTHTGERPHACDLCGMTFAQSSTLATHKKLKHKIPRKIDILKENNVASSSWGI